MSREEVKPGLSLLLRGDVSMVKRGAYGRRSGSAIMRDPGEQASRWIGVAAFFIGAVLLNGSVSADMLPINRALMAVDCSLITAWLLLLAIKSNDEQR